LLITKREIVGNAARRLQLHFVVQIIGKRIEALRRSIGRAREIGISLTLCDILGTRKSKRRHLCLREIVERREQLECGERAKHHVDLVALDEFLSLRLGSSR
jgi:hypothetical protein